MGDLKKQDLLAALAGIDAAAEQVVEEAKARGMDPWVGQTLDSARFFPEPVRLAVDARREEAGDAGSESLLHERARRIYTELTAEREPAWEVKRWREAERLETGERVFEVELLGIDLPVEGEELIPIQRRTDEAPESAYFYFLPSDFCECGHTRGSHRDGGLHPCLIDGCQCEAFRLMASGVEGVEEMPPDPHTDLSILDVATENSAIAFIRQLTDEAGLAEPDPELWMALQRLVSKGWRITPPADNMTTGGEDG